MAESKVAQQIPGWRTNAEIRAEHDRLATIYRQRGLSVLIETASDEIVKLRRASQEMADCLRAYLEDHGLTVEHSERARALLARLEG